MIVILGLVVLDINLLLPCLLLDGVVVTRCKRVDIDDAAMREDLVVDQRWEALTTQAEPDMAARRCVK